MTSRSDRRGDGACGGSCACSMFCAAGSCSSAAGWPGGQLVTAPQLPPQVAAAALVEVAQQQVANSLSVWLVPPR